QRRRGAPLRSGKDEGEAIITVARRRAESPSPGDLGGKSRLPRSSIGPDLFERTHDHAASASCRLRPEISARSPLSKAAVAEAVSLNWGSSAARTSASRSLTED